MRTVSPALPSLPRAAFRRVMLSPIWLPPEEFAPAFEGPFEERLAHRKAWSAWFAAMADVNAPPAALEKALAAVCALPRPACRTWVGTGAESVECEWHDPVALAIVHLRAEATAARAQRWFRRLQACGPHQPLLTLRAAGQDPVPISAMALAMVAKSAEPDDLWTIDADGLPKPRPGVDRLPGAPEHPAFWGGLAASNQALDALLLLPLWSSACHAQRALLAIAAEQTDTHPDPVLLEQFSAAWRDTHASALRKTDPDGLGMQASFVEAALRRLHLRSLDATLPAATTAARGPRL